MATKIEWCDETWNPVTGCSPVSAGCANCYARRMAQRLRGRFGYPADDPFKVAVHPERLDEPLHWRKPRRIFVCSMGDLFHEDVPVDDIKDVFDVMRECQRHTFILLTKRPRQARIYMEWFPTVANLWLGVSVEDQKTADERIPVLLDTPAAVRFISYEPALGPVDISQWLTGEEDNGVAPGRPVGTCVGYTPPLDWVIAGGESGPGARPAHPDWFRSVRDQCQEAGVPFFFKGWGEWCEWEPGIPANSTVHLAWSGESSDSPGWVQAPPLGRYCVTVPMGRAGKRQAGRLLDGREITEWPESTKGGGE